MRAPADEHATTLDVDRPHSVGQKHDRQNEPRRDLADGLLGDATRVIRRRRHVVQENRGSSRNEMNVGIAVVITTTSGRRRVTV